MYKRKRSKFFSKSNRLKSDQIFIQQDINNILCNTPLSLVIKDGNYILIKPK